VVFLKKAKKRPPQSATAASFVDKVT